MSASRQLAAIMFTDIVGYTALMGEDEQKEFDLLRKNRQLQKPVIEKFNGTWIKEIGDGVLASFHTVTDAAMCAIEIQSACNNIDDLKLRIGIHLGEVVFEDNDVFGDGVNIASRLQALAPIGGIWISESVHKNVSNKKDIKTKFVCEEVLKNVKEPVRVYEVTISNHPAEELAPKESKKKVSEKSIAVLPFVDMSPSRDQEYLGDGLAEELINLLSQIRGLKVIGRTSSFSFKKKDVDLKTIGQTLNANTILEGSVQKAGNRIRITIQLINAADGYHIWSQRYDRAMDDIFVLQDDISSKIAEHLKLTLLEDHETALEKKPGNSQAYEMYLKGDFYYKKYTPQGFERAIEYLEKAVELDPNFADAWIYLAMANYEMHGFLYFQPQRLKIVRSCIPKTLEIDATNANAHYLLALLNLNYDNDWEQTMREIELGNQYNKIPKLLSFLPTEAWARAAFYGEFDFAIRHIQKGLENDPINIEFMFHLALMNLYCIRDYKKTRSLLKEIIDMGFPEPVTWQSFCLANLFDGQFKEAEEYARKDYEACKGKGHGAANLIISLSASSKKEEAAQLYHVVKETLGVPDFPYFLHVRANAWLGRIDDAFAYLNTAIEEKSLWLFTLKVSPEWDPLRSDPRFQQVLKEMKFPE